MDKQFLYPNPKNSQKKRTTDQYTSYKIFTGLLRKHMKDHADRNKIWDKSQLGTCSGVLGMVDQLLIDSAIMDEVREKKRNLAVSFYNYQKA